MHVTVNCVSEYAKQVLDKATEGDVKERTRWVVPASLCATP